MNLVTYVDVYCRDGSVGPVSRYLEHFYPTAHKGCSGIVFTHGVRMGGQAGVGKKLIRAVSQKPQGVES